MKLAHLIASLAALLLAVPALADPPENSQGHHRHHEESDDQDRDHDGDEDHDHGNRRHDADRDRDEDQDEDRHFSHAERETINGYFRAHPEARDELPPGLAKQGKVPPGWRKKFARGQHIPDDVWERRVNLPPEVVTQLPPPPAGVIYVRVNDRVAKVVEQTHEILDILGLPAPRSMP